MLDAFKRYVIVVQLANGLKGMVVGDRIFVTNPQNHSITATLNIGDYKDNCMHNTSSELDIMAIFKLYDTNESDLSKAINDTENMVVVWDKRECASIEMHVANLIAPLSLKQLNKLYYYEILPEDGSIHQDQRKIIYETVAYTCPGVMSDQPCTADDCLECWLGYSKELVLKK